MADKSENFSRGWVTVCGDEAADSFYGRDDVDFGVGVCFLFK